PAVVGRLAGEAQHHGEQVLRAVGELEKRKPEVLFRRLLPGDVDGGGEHAPGAAVEVHRFDADTVPALVAAAGIAEIEGFAFAALGDPAFGRGKAAAGPVEGDLVG